MERKRLEEERIKAEQAEKNKVFSMIFGGMSAKPEPKKPSEAKQEESEAEFLKMLNSSIAE